MKVKLDTQNQGYQALPAAFGHRATEWHSSLGGLV